MSEVQSYLFDFQRSPSFFTNWNIKFLLSNMTNSENFSIVFCDYASDNINDCIDSNGILNTTNAHPIATIDCSLEWDGETEIITIRNDATWSIGDNHYPLKAVFICSKSTANYVMGYCINMDNFEVTNQIKFEAGTILWSIKDE